MHEDGTVEVLGTIKVEVPTIEEQKAEADQKLLDAFDEAERLKNLENEQ